MASITELFFLVTIVSISAVRSSNKLVHVKCEHSQGVYGAPSKLSCSVKTDEPDVTITLVKWMKEEKTLLTFLNDEVKPAAERFGFAEPNWNDKNMNVSLLIYNTEITDGGIYQYLVHTDTGNDHGDISFSVTAKYKHPSMNSWPEKIQEEKPLDIYCNTTGYPKGSIKWFDRFGAEWTRNSVLQVKVIEDKRVELSSKLNIMKADATLSPYKCIVCNSTGIQEGEKTFDIVLEHSIEPPEKFNGINIEQARKIVAPIVVIGSLACGLLLALLFFRKKHTQNRNNQENDDGPGEEEGLNSPRDGKNV